MGRAPYFAVEIPFKTFEEAKHFILDLNADLVNCSDPKIDIEEDDEHISATFRFLPIGGKPQEFTITYCSSDNEYYGHLKPSSVVIAHYVDYHEPLENIPDIIQSLLTMQEVLQGVYPRKKIKAHTGASTT